MLPTIFYLLLIVSHGTALSVPDVYRLQYSVLRRQLNPVYRLPSTVYPLLEDAYRYGYG
jgi:hypothetical protein